MLKSGNYTIKKFHKLLLESINEALLKCFRERNVKEDFLNSYFTARTEGASDVKRARDDFLRKNPTMTNCRVWKFKEGDIKYDCTLYEIKMDTHFEIKQLTNKCTINILFSKPLAYQLGQTDYYLQNPSQISSGKFKNAIDLTRQIQHSLWLHCDIVEPTLVGGNMLPLLRIMPLPTPGITPDILKAAGIRTTVARNQVFSILQWKRIISGRTNSIRVWFTVGDKPIEIDGEALVVLQIYG